MTIRKDEVLELLRQMPDEVDVEELIYRLYLLEKLAAAEADIAAGRTLSAEEVKAQTASWRR
jgi:predicted transcriptional regulator